MGKISTKNNKKQIIKALIFNDSFINFVRNNKLLLLYYFIPLFNHAELIQISKLNKTLYQIVKEFLNCSWKDELLSLAKVYNLEIDGSPIDLNKFQAAHNKRHYLIKGTKANYIEILLNNIKHYALIRGEKWSHYNNPDYWKPKVTSESLMGGPSYYLQNVCWIDLKLNFYNVKRGLYNVYLRTNINDKSLINLMTISIFIREESLIETTFSKIYYSDDFLNNEIYNTMKKNFNGRLMNVLLTRIDLMNFTEQSVLSVVIAIDHKTLWWKKGWLIDAAILEKINN